MIVNYFRYIVCTGIFTSFLLIWEKAVSWVPASEREGWDSDLGEARGNCALRAPRVGWVESWRCKSSQHRKIVSLSRHVEKPLNSKRWIKVSYLDQFRVFEFLYMFMNILWTLCLFYISVSWVCYRCRYVCIYSIPLQRSGCDTKSISKQTKTRAKPEFSFF